MAEGWRVDMSYRAVDPRLRSRVRGRCAPGPITTSDK